MNDPTLFAPTHSHAGVHVYSLLTVSVATLLFLIFLVCTPFSSHHKPLLLPATGSASPYLDTGDLVHISFQGDGSVFVDAKWYPVRELPSALEAAVRRAPSGSNVGLVLSIDRSLPFSSVRRLLRLLAAAGASRVTLEVEPTRGIPFLPGT